MRYSTPRPSPLGEPRQQGLAGVLSGTPYWRTMAGAALLACAAFITEAAGPTPVLVPLVQSYFESDSDGWRGINSSFGSESLTRLAGGPDPGSVAYISVDEDRGDGTTMYFAAPAKFLGDQRRAYHGALQFSLKQSATAEIAGSGQFVILSSLSLALSYSLDKVPPTTWHEYKLNLDEHSGWINNSTGNLATQEEVIAVLKDLRRLWIRAEYSYKSVDRSDLDDVQLLSHEEVAAPALVGIGAFAGLVIEGTVGRTYRIEYSDRWQAPFTFTTLTNVVLPESPHIFIDFTKPQVSNRFYRVRLLED